MHPVPVYEMGRSGAHSMGTDAFGFLEYRHFGEAVWHGEHLEFWHMRHYKMFDAIAGGRTGRQTALIPPRGIPKDCSQELMQRQFFVIASEADKLRRLENLPRGALKKVIDPANVPEDYTVITAPNGDRYANWYGFFEGHPDSGNATWLDTNELQACFNHIGQKTLQHEWHDLLVRMHTIEHEGGRARLVIWFTLW